MYVISESVTLYQFLSEGVILTFVLSITDGSKSKGGIYMVFEYMDHDLTGLTIRSGQTFTVPQVKVLDIF